MLTCQNPGCSGDLLVAVMSSRRGEPYSRHLQGPVRELRFHLGRAAWRLTYWLGPQQRVILLTVFRKTRGRETAEVNRAVLAQRICADKHEAATHVYDREE